MPELDGELRAEVNHYLRLGRVNHYSLYATYIAAVGASIAATVLASFGVSGPVMAVLTAVPGLLLMVNNTLKMGERSQWHYDKRRRLVSLLRELEVGVKTPADVVAAWNAIDADMDRTWPAFGALPKPSNAAPPPSAGA